MNIPNIPGHSMTSPVVRQQSSLPQPAAHQHAAQPAIRSPENQVNINNSAEPSKKAEGADQAKGSKAAEGGDKQKSGAGESDFIKKLLKAGMELAETVFSGLKSAADVCKLGVSTLMKGLGGLGK